MDCSVLYCNMKVKDMKAIQVGDEVRVGFNLMIVDEIIGDTIWCIDEDGQDHEHDKDSVDTY